MKVILKEDVKNLGTTGAVVTVADGFGRNYLIPQNLAAEANQKNIKRFEHEKKVIIEKAKHIKNTHEELAKELAEVTLIIEANAGEDGKLFGSVTSMNISEALSKKGFEVDKRKISLPEEAIKRLGTYAVQVKIHKDVTVNINLEVLPVKKIESS